MADQGTTTKVMRSILDPMQRFYGLKTLDDEVASAYIEELGRYDEATLTAAWKQVRRECKTLPKLAHFVEACEANRPRTTTSQQPQTNGYRCHRNEALADRVMRSPIGQLAIRLNVAQGVWMLAYRDGKAATESDVYRLRDSLREAESKLVNYPDKNGAQYRALEGVHRSISDKERELAARYSA